MLSDPIYNPANKTDNIRSYTEVLYTVNKSLAVLYTLPLPASF